MDRALYPHANQDVSLVSVAARASGLRRLHRAARAADCRNSLHLSRLWEVRSETGKICKLFIKLDLHADKNRILKRGTLLAKYASES
jgi:hypothetical protein